VNSRLKGLLPAGQFATMLYAIIDTQAHTLTYASAGALSPVCGPMCGIDGEEKTLDSAGIFLGISPVATYETRTVSLLPGGFVFLYSDALIESPTPAGQPLGEEGVLPSCPGVPQRQS